VWKQINLIYKEMKKILMTVLVLAGISATAQVKVGSNPTTIDTGTTNFQVEGNTTAEQFVILKDGKVGIGTTTPLEKLSINSNNIAGIRDLASFKLIGNGGGGRGTGILFGAGGSGSISVDVARITGLQESTATDANNASLTFQVADATTFALTERMRINRNGNVGIGTTAPTSKLQVVGLPTHATNAAAITAGLTAGAFYYAGDGIVRVVF
jgi:hypothetical protein